MKPYRVSVYASVEVNAIDDADACARAADEVQAGLKMREYEFTAEELDPPTVFCRPPRYRDDEENQNRLDDEILRPLLVVGKVYGFVFDDEVTPVNQIWGEVVKVTELMCVITRQDPDADGLVPLWFGLREVRVLLSYNNLE